MAVLLVAIAAASVTLHGVNGIRIGMTTAELRRMGGVVDAEGDSDPNVCSYWSLPNRTGVFLMVSRKRVVRIDFTDASFRTASGAAVGMTEAGVRHLYGRQIKVQFHPYTGPQGHYLVYRASGESYGMIFETDYLLPHRVKSFRVGLWDHVQLIEGCS